MTYVFGYQQPCPSIAKLKAEVIQWHNYCTVQLCSLYDENLTLYFSRFPILDKALFKSVYVMYMYIVL